MLRLGLLFAVVAILAAIVANIVGQEKIRPISTCSTDKSFHVTSLSSEDHPIEIASTCKFFSSSYEDAREKFRSAALTANAEVFEIPIVGEEYTMDVAIVRGRHQDAGYVVHSSGVHGVEGYAGSAIQAAILDQLQGKIKPSKTIVLIHAINPHGMAKMRRVNENNVDLNRNGLAEFQSSVLDPKVRPPNIANYDDIVRPIVTLDPSKDICSQSYNAVTWWFESAYSLFRYGFATMKRALVAGQYHHPEGLFYGGEELQPSIRTLEKFVTRKGIIEKDTSILNETTVWIDVHTGLGKFGMDTLMVSKMDKVGEDDICKVFPTPFDIVIESISTDMKAMSGYDLTVGVVMDYMQSRQAGMGDPSAQNNFFVIQEFGTRPGIIAGRALMLDHRLRQCGVPEDNLHYLQRVFYPNDPEWRRLVLQRGLGLVKDSLAYST